MTGGARAPGRSAATWLGLAVALGLAAGCGRPAATPPTAAPVAGAQAGAAPSYEKERAALDDAIRRAATLAAARPDDGLLPLEGVSLHLERARLTGDYEDYARAGAALASRPPSAGTAAAHCVLQARLDYSLHRLESSRRRLAGCGPGADAVEVAGLKADIDFHSGRYREAEAAYRALVNGVGTPTQFVRLALLRARTGSPGEAAALIEAAERRYHGRSATMKAWLRLQRGLVELDRGRFDEALALYRTASDFLPGWWLVDEHIAEVLALKGDKAASRALYAKVVERTGAPEFLDALAELEEEAGDGASASRRRAEARALYEKRLAAFPEAAAGHALDHFLDDEGAAPRALGLALANHATRPYGEASIALAKAWLHSGQPAKAAALLEAELAKGWDTPELHWVLAGAREKAGRAKDAQSARAAALARNPEAARLYGAP